MLWLPQQSRLGLSALTLVTHAEGAHCPDEVVCGSPLQSHSGEPLALGKHGDAMSLGEHLC